MGWTHSDPLVEDLTMIWLVLTGLSQKSCGMMVQRLGFYGEAQQKADIQVSCPQHTSAHMLMDGAAQWCLPALLYPEKQYHLSHMHSKNRSCLSQHDPGDPQSTSSAPNPLPPFFTGALLRSPGSTLVLAWTSKTSAPLCVNLR